MKEQDTWAYCYRVEERTIIPGVMVPTGKMIAGYPEIYEKKDLYLLVEGATERYIDAKGNYHTRTHEITTDKYFLFEEQARAKAVELHRKKGCNSPKCHWTRLVAIWDRK